MFSAFVFVGVLFAAFHGGECVVGWTTPAGGDAAFPAVAEKPAGDLTDLVVVATGATFVAANYEIERNSDGAFGFSTTTVGLLLIVTGKSLDYEQQATHAIIVKATDPAVATTTGTATVTIIVTDVLTDPVFSALSLCAVVSDLAAGGTTVATIAATDPQGTTPTYTIDTPAQTYFTVAAGGVVTVKAATPLLRTTFRAYYTVYIYAADTDASQTGTATLQVCCGTASQCASCSSSSGAAALTFSIMNIFALLLVLLR